ncbi:MAG: glycine cleavage system aminomethyltransferase GcvT [Candidatus Nanopelagicales bacterium]|nr:glycine cleavage system aminomethyltransferase GcvT [Candidatus Nanopelagicales bacterium]MDZ4250861.1 glycine cleavage system aminomethyltransferase GcvT [Candidatus Nanopelagicales bacterium]
MTEDRRDSRRQELKETPITAWNRAAGAKMADFAGWAMPIEYPAGTISEHRAVRSGCGLFDVSHMGTVRISGGPAVARLNETLTNDLAVLDDGQVQYTLLCDENGGVVDDMLATRMRADEVLLVPNASNTAAVLAVLREALGDEAVVDEGDVAAILAVQGPASPGVLESLGLPSRHRYLTVETAKFEGVPVIVSRTGYTGEVGFEIFVPVAAAARLWESLIQVPAVTPAGLGARDTLRTEMGYPLHGHELSASIGPVEAGLAWAVAWDKPHFIGDAELRRQRAEGPKRRLRGVRVTGRGVPRPGMVVREGGRDIGLLTSGTFSPTLGTGIGLALVEPDVPLDSEVDVDIRGKSVAGLLVRPPFVDSSPK